MTKRSVCKRFCPDTGLALVEHADNVEDIAWYRKRGYQPIELGFEIHSHTRAYTVIHKLGSSPSAIVWLCQSFNSDGSSAYNALSVSTAGYDDSFFDLYWKEIKSKLESMQHGSSSHLCWPLEEFAFEGPNGQHLVHVYPVLGPAVNLGVKYMNRSSDDAGKGLVSACKSVVETVAALNRVGVAHEFLRAGDVRHRIQGLDGLSKDEVLEILGRPKLTSVMLMDDPDDTTDRNNRESSMSPIPGAQDDRDRADVVDNATLVKHDKLSAPQYLVSAIEWGDQHLEVIADDICIANLSSSFPRVDESIFTDVGCGTTPGPVIPAETEARTNPGREAWALARAALLEIPGVDESMFTEIGYGMDLASVLPAETERHTEPGREAWALARALLEIRTGLDLSDGACHGLVYSSYSEVEMVLRDSHPKWWSTLLMQNLARLLHRTRVATKAGARVFDPEGQRPRNIIRPLEEEIAEGCLFTGDYANDGYYKSISTEESEDLADLLGSLLRTKSKERARAADLLAHPWFSKTYEIV